jgi:hypothetical protein
MINSESPPDATASMEAQTAAWSEAKLPMQHWVTNAEGLRTGYFEARGKTVDPRGKGMTESQMSQTLKEMRSGLVPTTQVLSIQQGNGDRWEVGSYVLSEARGYGATEFGQEGWAFGKSRPSAWRTNCNRSGRNKIQRAVCELSEIKSQWKSFGDGTETAILLASKTSSICEILMRIPHGDRSLGLY